MGGGSKDPLQISKDQITQCSLSLPITAVFSPRPEEISSQHHICTLFSNFQFGLPFGEQCSSHLLCAAHSSLQAASSYSAHQCKSHFMSQHLLNTLGRYWEKSTPDYLFPFVHWQVFVLFLSISKMIAVSAFKNYFFKLIVALTSVAQLVRTSCHKLKGYGFNSWSWLSCRFSPLSGAIREAMDWCFSLTSMFPSLSPSLPLSLKINKHVLGWG